MSVKRQIEELFRAQERAGDVPTARALLEEAIELADDAEDEDLGYRARMRLLAFSASFGDDEVMLTTFTWCVAHHEADPERFQAVTEDSDLLWTHKWIPSLLTRNPLFPREDVDAALDQLTNTFRRAGIGESGVVQTKLVVALRTGRLDEATTWFETLRTTPEDDYSDCAACVASHKIGYLLDVGREEEAIALAEEAVADGLSCGEEPEALMSQVLPALLAAGRVDQARAWHHKSYRLSRTDPHKLDTIASHIEFCALVGDLARGLELLDRHLGWLGRDRLNLDERLDALLAVGTLLEALVLAGEGGQPVPRAADPRVIDVLGAIPEPTAAAVAARVWDQTAELAAAFDARNGNRWYAERRQRARDRARAVPPGGSALPARPVTVEAPVDAAAWAERAMTCAALGLDGEAGQAVRAGLALDPPSAVRARLLATAAAVTSRADLGPVIEQRVAALRDAGDDALADLEEALGPVRWVDGPDPGDVEHVHAVLAGVSDPWVRVEGMWTLSRMLPEGEAGAVVAEILELAERVDHPLRAADAAYRLATVALAEDRIDDALALADRALAHLDRAATRASAGERVGTHLVPAPERARSGATLLARASALASLGRLEEAVAVFEVAADLAVTIPSRPMAADTYGAMASLLEQLDRPHDALPRWRAAVTQAELGELGWVPALRAELGRALLGAGRPDESAEVLERVLDEVGEDERVAAEAMFYLGVANDQLGEHGAAYQMWREVLETTTGSEDHTSAARAGAALAQLLARFDDDEAAEMADEAVAAARRTEDPGILMATLQHCAPAWADADPERALTGVDEALAIARDLDDPGAVADLVDTRARVLAGQGEVDTAVSAALEAADLFTAVGMPLGAASATLLAGQVLLDADRPADAVVLLAEAVEASEDHPGMHAHACLLAGDCYETLGRHGEAERMRARVSG